jgi:hypothetical protein
VVQGRPMGWQHGFVCRGATKVGQRTAHGGGATVRGECPGNLREEERCPAALPEELVALPGIACSPVWLRGAAAGTPKLERSLCARRNSNDPSMPVKLRTRQHFCFSCAEKARYNSENNIGVDPEDLSVDLWTCGLLDLESTKLSQRCGWLFSFFLQFLVRRRRHLLLPTK